MLKNYFIVAYRSLLRRKGFSLINITGLAVGMTACFLIFLYVRFETSYDRFHTKADRIYRVVSDVVTPSGSDPLGITIAPIYVYAKKDFAEVEDAVRISRDEILVRKGDKKFQEKNTVFADSTLFNIFDFPLISGDKTRALTEPMSIVLSQSAAKKYFGDKDPMGQELQVTGAAINAKVTGVMQDIPPNSQIIADMIISISSYKQVYGNPTDDNEWTNHSFFTYLLLKPGADPKTLQAKFPAFIDAHHGEDARRLQMRDELFLELLLDVYLKSTRGGFITGSINNVRIFSVIAIFILLIACFNFVNLTTARSAERAKEVGVRKVVGAGKYQLARQFLLESVIISLLAFVIAVFLCLALLPLFNRLAGKTISENIFDQPVNMVLLFLLAIAIGFIAGFYPSLVLSSFKPVSVLKGRFVTGKNGLVLRQSLVVFQFTISIALIVATIVVSNQLNHMQKQNLGFTREQTIVINTNFDKNKETFNESLASIPGVISTTMSSTVPGSWHTSAYSQIQNAKGELQKMNIDLFFVDFNYIKQYELKIVAGRSFDKTYMTDSSKAMVINESAARFLGYSSPGDAVGRDYDQWGSKGKIIGVVKDFNYHSLQQKIAPMVMRYEPWGLNLLSIKVSPANITSTVKSIEANWNKIIPNRPFDYSFLDEFFNKQYQSEEKFGNLFFNFAVLAIFISCLGLLGLASYSTVLRNKEVGVRKVLGAGVAGIVNLLSVDFIKLVLIALVIAVPVAWYAMNLWLQSFAYRTPITWQVFATAGIVSVLIAFLTISYQAIKAATANPVKSLKSE